MNPHTTYAVQVDVLTQTGWQTFETIKEAAVYIGVTPSTLTVALRKEKPCKGFHVRRNEEAHTKRWQYMVDEHNKKFGFESIKM